jgi:hypothetical protein
MSTTTKKISMIAGLIMLVSMGTSYAENNAGMIKQTKGSVVIERGEQKLDAKQGVKVLVSDRVVTGADSSVGITLHDGTLLSAGSNSTLSINKFVFDTTTNAGELDASLKRGTLAVVSGKLSKTSSNAVTYRTPTTILGVRGTEFVIEANSNED